MALRPLPTHAGEDHCVNTRSFRIPVKGTITALHCESMRHSVRWYSQQSTNEFPRREDDASARAVPQNNGINMNQVSAKLDEISSKQKEMSHKASMRSRQEYVISFMLGAGVIWWFDQEKKNQEKIREHNTREIERLLIGLGR
ncbi:hypothetical protein MMC28_002404 [Mycoblastus sanguinarius]|nr:hypothetical protein [Mycoblastus sanguinarius]